MKFSKLIRAMFAPLVAPLYANTQAMCTSFKTELPAALHAFTTTAPRGSSAADTFKAALYTPTATVNASTTGYSATNEVASAGYTAGGVTIGGWNAPNSTGTRRPSRPPAA